MTKHLTQINLKEERFNLVHGLKGFNSWSSVANLSKVGGKTGTSWRAEESWSLHSRKVRGGRERGRVGEGNGREGKERKGEDSRKAKKGSRINYNPKVTFPIIHLLQLCLPPKFPLPLSNANKL